MASAPDLLATEAAQFERHRARWLDTHKGQYALIRGEECFGFFDTPEEAYRAGVKRFGTQLFMFKRVMPEDEVLDLPALTLGVIRVDP